MKKLSPEICAQIRAARRAAKLSQEIVADEIGCNQSALSMFEQGDGTKLSEEIVGRLAKKFGISLKAGSDESSSASKVDSEPVVTLGSHAIFMNKNKGKHLICEAHCIRDGRHACFYEVNVTDDYGTEIARVRVEGYRLLKD